MNEWLRRLLALPPQGSTFARQVDTLHYTVVSTAMAGAVCVTAVAAVFIVRYRRRGKRRPELPPPTPPWRDFLIGGLLFALFSSFWIVGFRQYSTIRAAPPEALEIYVSAKQWMWTFAYADGTVSNSTLVVPAHRPVKLIMSSRDVIHSFYVPAFRLKQDVVPGSITTTWFEAEPGRYEILCAELCGMGHSTMRGEVIALPPSEYAPRGERLAPLAERGRIVAAQQGCLRCHTLDGTPHIGPTWAGLYRASIPLEGGGTVVADEAYLTESMMDPLAKVHARYKPTMPAYQGVLPPADVAALVELIKSLPAPTPVDP